MRLNCNVVLADLNGSGKNAKPCKAVISVGFQGPKENSVPLLLIATNTEKSGLKYRVKENVDMIYGKFVSEGKCTIRLKEPKKDIMISAADSVQLKTFLQIICSVLKTGTAPELNILRPIERHEIVPQKLKMTIRNRTEYPLNKSFPSALKELVIEPACQLKRIDTRIFQLQNLSILCLCNQLLTTISCAIFKLNLSELNLSGNKLETLPQFQPDMSSNLLRSLSRLDLSSNKLETLPEIVTKMSKLFSLNISNNKIRQLPNMSPLINLRELRATSNFLEFLRFSSLKTNQKYSVFDVFGNNFVRVPPGERVLSSEERAMLPEHSLMLLTANKVADIMRGTSFERLQEFLPRTVISKLNQCEKCMCTKFTIDGPKVLLSVDLFHLCDTVVSIDGSGTTSVPVEFKLCSSKCELKLSRRIVS